MSTPATGIDPAIRKPLDHEIDTWGLTHVGNKRQLNQDNFVVASLHKRTQVLQSSVDGLATMLGGDERLAYLIMVADGVGGAELGEEASRLAVATAMEYVSESMRCYYTSQEDPGQFAEELQQAAMQCHERVQAHAHDARAASMATTLTVFLGVWPNAYLMQVGDSRYYVYRDDQLTQVTRDQTMAEDLVDQGIITRTAAMRTPLAHVLSSAIGGEQTTPVVTRLEAHRGNVHLLCSDGLTKHVSDERIKARLATMTSARQACEALLRDALDGGGTDNITLVISRVLTPDEPGAASPCC
ncbi:MAG: PP2C family protein-serine/threonine phosphatase [Gemmatimonadales bacterium]